MDILRPKERDGRVSPEWARRLTNWIEKGFVILESAVSHADVDALIVDIENARSGRNPGSCRDSHAISCGKSSVASRDIAAAILELRK